MQGCTRAMAKLNELDLEQRSRSSYSPDLALGNYFLFPVWRSKETKLRNKMFLTKKLGFIEKVRNLLIYPRTYVNSLMNT